jgi:hypothetical protein
VGYKTAGGEGEIVRDARVTNAEKGKKLEKKDEGGSLIVMAPRKWDLFWVVRSASVGTRGKDAWCHGGRCPRVLEVAMACR